MAGSWSEPPVFQQIYGRRIGSIPDAAAEPLGAEPRVAVEEALELLHDDYAYEFQIGWSLWEHETAGELDSRWVREPRLVRVTGFGPLFDEGAYEADGHIRVDFGTDTPFLEEDLELDSVAARHVEENVRQLVELTAAVEKASGATARLLWSELGESLAQRLALRLRAIWDGELAVRLTIEWLRTLVLAAGVLLVAALGVFLVVAKYRRQFNVRELPKRLGIDIQQEANGVTYSHALGSHSQFKIHASKVVELKNNHALLHDVKIELYGADGGRLDRIEGDEFEYDQENNTATAAGPVEITMMRPGVAPAVAPKAIPGKILNDKKPIAKPLASVAETAEKGQIHIKTSGLTFDYKSGVTTTNARVDFQITQGEGSSMGARYDSQSGMLILEHAVELTTWRGASPVQIHAQHAEFDRDDLAVPDARGHGGLSPWRGNRCRGEDSLPRGWVSRAAGCNKRLYAGDGHRRTRGGAHWFDGL